MPVISLTTRIRAPIDRCFDLARNVEIHLRSTAKTNEKAVSGVTRGLIGFNDEVTWEARHLGIKQRLTVRVTAFARPSHFQDVMVRGAFKRMVHDHTFVEVLSGTVPIISETPWYAAPLRALITITFSRRIRASQP